MPRLVILQPPDGFEVQPITTLPPVAVQPPVGRQPLGTRHWTRIAILVIIMILTWLLKPLSAQGFAGLDGGLADLRFAPC
jgi:hypothetical protein